MIQKASFVVFPLGERQFAVPSGPVSELARPDRLHTFPHTTARIMGVLLRRGQIIAVLDIAELLGLPAASARRLYLIANRKAAGRDEFIAIPVTGECELISADVEPCGDTQIPYIVGRLSHEGGSKAIPVLNLNMLLEAAEQSSPKHSRQPECKEAHA